MSDENVTAESAAKPEEAAPAGPAAPAPAAPATSPQGGGTKVPRGAIGVAVVAAAIPLLIMCTERRFAFSVPVGFACCLVSAIAILFAVGSFEPAGEGATQRTLGEMRPRLVSVLLAGALHVGALMLAVAGVLPKPIATAAVLVPATFLGVVVALYRLARAAGGFHDPDQPDRPLLERHGFWLVVLHAAVYLPLLGSYSLSDPWETHYGEVAREMLARDDWISTWWAQDGWFWSKPVLDFWSQALSFSMLGVKYLPDQMLASAALGRFPQPEWAARMPVFLLTLAGAYVLYRAVAAVAGRRAGFLAGLALTTMPYWYLVAHQTMTDMPYVGPLAAAMGFVLLGFLTDPARELRPFELRVGARSFHVTAVHLVLVAVIVSALPQILYLASRNLTLHLDSGYTGFRFHADEFFAGSGGGNCGLPGNQNCQKETAVHKELWPIMAAGIWAAVLGVFVWNERHERRLARVYFLSGWYFLALSMLGKGAPGLVLPLATAGAFAVVTNRFKDLGRAELLGLVLVIACVGLPWYVQMYMRHGAPFIDRLIMHDMYKRAFVHVHDTNQGDDTTFRYYVWQLGYGLFPWTGLAAGGLLWGLRRSDRTRDLAGDLSAFMIAWFVAAFGMFTITLTKFHHYILPLVPPTAVLTGIVVDRLLGAGSPARPGRAIRYWAALLGSVALVAYGILRCFPGGLLGTAGVPPARTLGIAAILAGVVLAIGSVRRSGAARAGGGAGGRADPYDDAAFLLVGLGSAVAIALAGRDMIDKVGTVNGNARLMHLFTYNYGRPWPESLDFSGASLAFTVLGVVLSLGVCLPRFRTHATALFCATAVVWSAWGLNVYLDRCAPHWGQRETVLAYYADRKRPEYPLVAYQMNWKGENFYTGNKVPAFVASGEKFKTWIADQKTRGINVMYFTSEHGRVGALKRELGDPPRFVELTDKKLNNKFFLARVEF